MVSRVSILNWFQSEGPRYSALLLCPVRNDRSIAVKLDGLSYGDENGTGSQGPEPPWHPGRPENRRLHGIEGYTICPGMAAVIESTEPLPGSA